VTPLLPTSKNKYMDKYNKMEENTHNVMKIESPMFGGLFL
jgi:hypothetical protein